MFVVLFPTPTPHPPTPAEFHSDPIFVMNTHSFLPPAFRRNGEGNVFTGVCLHLRGGAGTPIWPTGGIPLPRSGWGSTPSQVRTGGTPPPPAGWGTPPRRGPRSGGDTPNWNSMACTCCAAGGMPLAFTQEDFLVYVRTAVMLEDLESVLKMSSNPGKEKLLFAESTK